MKEFIEKLIGRLEEEKQRLRKLKNDTIALSDSEVIAIEEQAYNFCKAIVNQLAEEYEECLNLCSENCEVYDKEKHYCPKWCKVIKDTVAELKEEYFKNAMIDGQYCWQTCGATEHCKECNRLGNGSIDYYENYDCLAEEYGKDTNVTTNGWIPMAEMLFPRYEQKVLASVKCEDCKHEIIITKYERQEYWNNGIITAWQPLPAPYQQKEGEQ